MERIEFKLTNKVSGDHNIEINSSILEEDFLTYRDFGLDEGFMEKKHYNLLSPLLPKADLNKVEFYSRSKRLFDNSILRPQKESIYEDCVVLYISVVRKFPLYYPAF